MKFLLMIAIAILAVACGGKDEPTTETKPLEEKAVEVKEEAKTEEPLAETEPELEGINAEKLEERESIWYLKDSETPYTGKVYSLHPNGQKKQEGNFKEGKTDGLLVRWHKNGQKEAEGNFKDGKRDGLHVRWHENGQKKQEGNNKDGKYDGLQVLWYESGQKEREINYKDGEMDGLQVWYYENGRKHLESNWKDGKENGLWMVWHNNGQKRNEGNFKDGEKVSAKYWNSKGEPVDSLEEAKK